MCKSKDWTRSSESSEKNPWFEATRSVIFDKFLVAPLCAESLQAACARIIQTSRGVYFSFQWIVICNSIPCVCDECLSTPIVVVYCSSVAIIIRNSKIIDSNENTGEFKTLIFQTQRENTSRAQIKSKIWYY